MSWQDSWASASRLMLPASAFRHWSIAVLDWVGSLIPVPDCSRHWHFYSFRYQTDRMRTVRHSGIYKNCMKVEKDAPFTSILLVVESDTPCHLPCWCRTAIHPARPHQLRRRWIHPARPYSRPRRGKHPCCLQCWRWRGIHPACPHCRHCKCMDTHCKSTLQTPCQCWRYKRDAPCTMHMHTVCGGKGKSLTFILLVVQERKTPHVHTVDCRIYTRRGNTLTSTLLVVESDTPSCPHCWLWKAIHSHVHPHWVMSTLL